MGVGRRARVDPSPAPGPGPYRPAGGLSAGTNPRPAVSGRLMQGFARRSQSRAAAILFWNMMISSAVSTSKSGDLALQALDLLLGDILGRLRSSLLGCQGLQCARLPLSPPVGRRRAVQPLAAHDGPDLALVGLVGLLQSELVRRLEPASLRLLARLGVGRELLRRHGLHPPQSPVFIRKTTFM